MSDLVLTCAVTPHLWHQGLDRKLTYVLELSMPDSARFALHVGLGQGTAEERVALLLLDFRGRLALSGAVAADAQTYQMPMTQAQLADHLGITAVHVNRVLRSFRERGIVSVRDGKVSITDLDALSRHAAPLLDTYEKSTAQYVGHAQMRQPNCE